MSHTPCKLSSYLLLLRNPSERPRDQSFGHEPDLTESKADCSLIPMLQCARVCPQVDTPRQIMELLYLTTLLSLLLASDVQAKKQSQKPGKNLS